MNDLLTIFLTFSIPVASICNVGKAVPQQKAGQAGDPYAEKQK